MNRRPFNGHCKPECAPFRFEDLTDSQTGTSYVRCKTCGTHHLASQRGYVDWRMGIFVDDGYHVGSLWTQSMESGFFAKPSDLTDG